MSRVERNLILWEHVSRVQVTTGYTVVSLVAPPSTYLSPYLSVTAILFAIVYGLLIALLHWLGGTPRSQQRTGTIGVIYVLLAAFPFILAQFIFSANAWPLLPTILVAHLAPVLLIAVSFRQAPMRDPGLSFLNTLLSSHRLLYHALALVNSVITGYGLPFLCVYLYAWFTQQIFGHLTLANLGLLLLVGGMLAGLIYGRALRASRQWR